MRTLNAQEMDAASGGVIPLIGLIVAVASVAVKSATATKVLAYTGVAIAGASAYAYGNGLLNGEMTVDGLSCKP